MDKLLAPIVLFVYNRPEHTLRTLKALAENRLAPASTLFIYADGAKLKATVEDKKKIAEVRKIIRQEQWCKNVHIIDTEINQGLATSITTGVTRVVNEFGKVIVLEDDLVTSKYFLDFINDGLEVYQDVSNIYSVNGFMHPINWEGNRSYLLPYISTWGWGTWKDKWEAFSPELEQKECIKQNKFLRNRFDLNNYSPLLDLNKKQSWGIRWYLSVFRRNGLGVFPSQSLVQNIGFDGSGTNNFRKRKGSKMVEEYPIPIIKEDMIDLAFYDIYSKYHLNKRMNPILNRLSIFIKNKLKYNES